MKRKKTALRIVKRTYGTRNIEDVVREALEPYFPGIEVTVDKESENDEENEE